MGYISSSISLETEELRSSYWRQFLLPVMKCAQRSLGLERSPSEAPWRDLQVTAELKELILHLSLHTCLLARRGHWEHPLGPLPASPTFESSALPGTTLLSNVSSFSLGLCVPPCLSALRVQPFRQLSGPTGKGKSQVANILLSDLSLIGYGLRPCDLWSHPSYREQQRLLPLALEGWCL